MSFWKRKRKDRGTGAESVTEEISVQCESDSEIDWQAKYSSEHEAFERYRAEIASADERRRKEEAYRTLLSGCGIPEKYRGRLAGLCSTDSFELDDAGNIIGGEKIAEAVRDEWSDLIPASSVPVASPPMYRGQAMTRESIMAIKDRDARRSAILENFELFG